jgi:predicted Zn-dependent protease
MLDIIQVIKMKFILLIITLLFFANCSKQKINDSELECCDPHALICLQPYNDFSEEEAKKLVPILEEHFNINYGFWSFKVNKPINLPLESKVGEKYKAITVLNYEKKLLQGDEIIIGLTHKDICTDIHNTKNYGIVGLSFTRSQVCLVSDKRLSNKSNFWKPILHEFMHTFYGSRHCPNDDPKCIMKDAKGHGNFAIQEYLCDSCIKR